MPAIQEKEIVWKKLIQCKQKQWTSSLRKEKYCQDCEVKELCYAVIGK